MNHSRLLFCLLIASSLALSGCGSWWLPRAHKIDVQQGNLLPPEAVDKVAKGMTRKQVIGLLGKPVLTSLFNKDRWDYVYSINRSGETPQAKRLTVFFQDNAVSKLERSGLDSEETG